MTYELGFLGAGNMAEAIARAAIDRSVLTPQQLIASDPSEARRALFAGLGAAVAGSNAEVIRQSRQVLVAVKPQTMPELAPDLAAAADGQVIISIMAGVTSMKIADAVRAAGGRAPHVVRVMPNTPLQVGYGMAGISLGAGAQPGDEGLALRLFGAGGKAVVLEERLLDAITAVSGSGPAYVFYLAEAMERVATELGLGEHARLLVSQTVLGAAHLLAASGEAPAELRRKVTSPGGTTEAAIRHLDGNKTTEVIINAVRAAEARSRELGA